MTSEDLKLLELELKMDIPDYYKNIMLNYPLVHYDNCSNIRIAFMDDKNWLIEENKELRCQGFYNHVWPDYFFAFGHDGCGDYYFIDCRDKKSGHIYFADHEKNFNKEKMDIFMPNLKVFLDSKINLNQVKQTV